MLYHLRNKKTGLLLQGYKGNKPLWIKERISDINTPAAYSEEDAVKLQKRLECQSQFTEAVEIKDNS